MATTERRWVPWLGVTVLALLVVSGLHPYERSTWFMEVAPIFLAAPVVVLTAKRFPLSSILYVLIAVHAVILMVGGASAGGDQGEHPAAFIGLAGAFPAKMSGDALDVFHQRHRIFKDVVIDALEDITHAGARLIEKHTVGVVDMPASVRLRAQEFPVDLQVPRHAADVMFHFHCLKFVPIHCPA